LYHFPCPQWLDRAGNTWVTLYLGQKPTKPTSAPVTVTAPAEEEDWQALVAVPEQATEDEDTSLTGVNGSYTVSLSPGSYG